MGPLQQKNYLLKDFEQQIFGENEMNGGID